MEIIYENKNEKSLVRLTRFDIIKMSKYELMEYITNIDDIRDILDKYYEDILYEVIDLEEYILGMWHIPFEYFDLISFLYDNMKFGDINVFMYGDKFIYVRIYP